MLRRILLWTLAAVLIATVAGGLWVRRVVTGPAPATGELVLPGLEQPVEVMRDSLGVPHVWAGSMTDAVFAQGYLHATDRLWQMEMFRRVAQGRLSELFGEDTIDADRFLRTLGLARAGRGSAAVISAETRALGEAYAGGVNAAMAEWRGPLPPEFMLLRADFEPWDLYHTLAIEKIMAWDLSQYGTSVSMAGARAAVGDEAVRELLPRYPEWGVTILEDVPGGATADVDAPGIAAPGNLLPPRVSAELAASARIPQAALAPLEAASIVRASNSWVVGGGRTRSGMPLVANDMHLSIDQPVIWYLIGLHAPGLDVVGQSLPGAPGVIGGHTAGVAWGYTNAMVDDSDFFIERVDPADSTRYLTPDGSEPFLVREESIEVSGREEPVALVVRETRHGPVMTPVEALPGGELLAYRWGAHDPSTTFDGLLGLNRANTAADLIAALQYFSSPYQNVVFADTAGNFGYWLAGAIPLRRSGRPTLLPVPGWTGEHDWTGTLPFEHNPHVLNPASGFIASANNRQSRDSLTLQISPDRWERPYRAQRITELLEARSDHDTRSASAIQRDVQSSFIARYRDKANAAFRESGLDSLARALDTWDGRATLESTETTLFYTWIESVREDMRGRFYQESGGYGYFPRYMVERGLEEEDAAIDALAAAAALRVAGGDMLPWGRAHTLHVAHPFETIPVLGSLLGFGRRDIPRRGDPYTVDVASFSGSAPPFEVTAGASQRSVADLADLGGGGGFILPGGQSGLPASRHSWDQFERWQRGDLWRLPLDRDAVEARAISRLTLLPR